MSSSSVPRTSGIYKITCIPTGKFYIGSSVNIGERWAEHKRLLRIGKHENCYLQNAWNKHGEQSFAIEVIEFVMPWSLLDREQYFLDTLKPFKSRGFNIAPVASKPPSITGHSEATRAKISQSHIGIRPNAESKAKMSTARAGKKFGPHSSETRAKIGAANTGKVRSAAERANLSQKLKGRIGTFTGRKHTEAAIEKMAESKRQNYIFISPDGEEFTARGLTRFCEERGLHSGHMAEVVTGKRGSCQGWKCRRKDNG
jgi:group I intron endonuclease